MTRLGLIWVGVLAAWWVGCGDDPAVDSTDGAVSDTGFDASAIDAGDGGPRAVTCGQRVCDVFPAGGLSGLGLQREPCCVVPDVCGVTNQMLFGGEGMTCFERADGPLTAQCPSENLTPLSSVVSVAGCCRADNACGLHLNLGGDDYGCVERSVLAEALSRGSVWSGDAPSWTSMSCSADDHDAGGSAGGSSGASGDGGTGGVGGSAGEGGSGGEGGVGGSAGEGGSGGEGGSSGEGGSGGDDRLGGCSQPSSFTCQEHYGQLNDVSPLSAACAQTLGTWLTACPQDGLIAECAYPQGTLGTRGVLFYYEGAPATEQQLRDGCEQGLSGTFTWRQ